MKVSERVDCIDCHTSVVLILRLAHVLVYLLVVVAAEVLFTMSVKSRVWRGTRTYRAILDEVAVFVAGSNVGKVD